MSAEVLEIVALFMGSASVTAWTTYYIAKKKLPAEKDSIIVTGASAAVATLQAALSAETARADRAEARVALLQSKLDLAQQTLNEVRAELHALTTEISSRPRGEE